MTITVFRRRYATMTVALYVTMLLGVPSCANRHPGQGTTMGTSRSLPPPDTNASVLMQALKKRKTSREFADKPLENQLLSGLLWAAYGINRADGKRTAPSAHDWQYIDVYVADPAGLYRYNAKNHALDLVKPGDIRAQTGLQSFAATAPVDLVLVSDQRKFPADVSAQDQLLFAATTGGAIAQNVYLFAAANNLNAGVRSDIDREALHKTMGLLPEQKIIVALSVGAMPTIAAVKATLRSLLGRN